MLAQKLVGSEGQYYRRNSIEGLKRIEDPCDADEVDRKCRAFYFPPFEPAHFEKGGRRFYVLPEGTNLGTLPKIDWQGDAR